MALRRDDPILTSGGVDSTVVRFPVERAHARRRRTERMLARRRRSAVVLTTSLLVVGFLLADGPQGASPAAPERHGRRAVTIGAGETLWDVAEEHAPQRSDLRAYVDALSDINGTSAPLAGERIRLP